MKYIAVVIWLSSPSSKPTVTVLSAELPMAECLVAVGKAVKATSANIASAGCMSQEALALMRMML